MAPIPNWDNRNAAASALYALDFRDGYLVWSKGHGTPTDADWAVFMSFISMYAPRAQGLFAFLAGGAINVAQRAEVMGFLTKLQRCKFAALVGENLARGSVTAMSWAGANSGYSGASYNAADVDKALDFIEAKGVAERAKIKSTLRRLTLAIGADTKNVLLPHLEPAR